MPLLQKVPQPVSPKSCLGLASTPAVPCMLLAACPPRLQPSLPSRKVQRAQPGRKETCSLKGLSLPCSPETTHHAMRGQMPAHFYSSCGKVEPVLFEFYCCSVCSPCLIPWEKKQMSFGSHDFTPASIEMAPWCRHAVEFVCCMQSPRHATHRA